MAKFELSLAPNYVPDWGVVEASRELFQNGIDQEATNPENRMTYSYDKETEVLKIGNKLSVLEASSLLLGGSTKADDENTIGKFGEGYKIATLVLLRLGKNITFYNYGKKEVWRPRFVKSRRYGGTNILTFFTEKYIWKKVPDRNLTIVVEGITENEWIQIRRSNLHCQVLKMDEYYITSKGRVLLNERYKGKLFVNGLYVCNSDALTYGYDVKPAYIKLDRDRGLVDSFQLNWLTSQLWIELPKTPEVIELLREGAPEVQYLSAQQSKPKDDIANIVATEFVATHGDNAYPVSEQKEMDRVKAMYPTAKPIIVDRNQRDLIKKAEVFAEPEQGEIEDLAGLLQKWFVDTRWELVESSREAGQKLFDELKKYDLVKK